MSTRAAVEALKDKGMDAKEIGHVLNLTTQAVQYHLKRIREDEEKNGAHAVDGKSA